MEHYSIAVLDVDKEGCWVWHVNANLTPSMSSNRLTGAWKIVESHELLVNLINSRFVLSTNRFKNSKWQKYVDEKYELNIDDIYNDFPEMPEKQEGVDLILSLDDEDITDFSNRRCLKLATWISNLLDVWEEIEKKNQRGGNPRALLSKKDK